MMVVTILFYYHSVFFNPLIDLFLSCMMEITMLWVVLLFDLRHIVYSFKFIDHNPLMHICYLPLVNTMQTNLAHNWEE